MVFWCLLPDRAAPWACRPTGWHHRRARRRPLGANGVSSSSPAARTATWPSSCRHRQGRGQEGQQRLPGADDHAGPWWRGSRTRYSTPATRRPDRSRTAACRPSTCWARGGHKFARSRCRARGRAVGIGSQSGGMARAALSRWPTARSARAFGQRIFEHQAVQSRFRPRMAMKIEAARQRSGMPRRFKDAGRPCLKGGGDAVVRCPRLSACARRRSRLSAATAT